MWLRVTIKDGGGREGEGRWGRERGRGLLKRENREIRPNTTATERVLGECYEQGCKQSIHFR